MDDVGVDPQVIRTNATVYTARYDTRSMCICVISLPGLIGGVLFRRASTAALNIKYTGSIDVLEEAGAVVR